MRKKDRAAAAQRWLYLHEMQAWREHCMTTAIGRPWFPDFSSYVESYPEGQPYERFVGRGILVPCYPEAGGFPGDFYVIKVTVREGQGCVIVHDIDDGFITKLVEGSPKSSFFELDDLIDMAPFYLAELQEFGYSF